MCQRNSTTNYTLIYCSDVGPGDEGVYTCTAINPYGESTCTLNVRYF